MNASTSGPPTGERRTSSAATTRWSTKSLPDWPWHRVRKESPGVYESYADMAEGEWIHMKIVVLGTKAALYLGNAAHPCLLINDVKLGDAQGAIALWGGSGTVGYFANLKISNSK